jgi:3'(2'), 5'-bisphosphate nucleotidase
MDWTYFEEFSAAMSAARRASRLILKHYASFEKIEDAPADISTVADRAGQEVILQCLHEDFPDDALCAEEQTPTLAGAAKVGTRIWIVDPIDGSRGFAKKNGEFSVMIGFVEQGQVQVGVVLEPAKGRLTAAVRGQGCWTHDRRGEHVRCRVSGVGEPAKCSLIQSHSKPGKPSWPVAALKPARVIETYSAGVKLARVARGEADVYVNTYSEFHDWDIAAGHLLVEEAGGRATGLKGEVLQYGQPGAKQRQGLIAANPALLERCVQVLSEERTK